MKISPILYLACLAACHASNYGEYCTKNDLCQGDTQCFRPLNCKYGLCDCKPGFVHTTGNGCKPLKKIGDGCSTTSDCHGAANSLSTCSNHKCRCNNGLSADVGKTVCAKHTGDPCTISSDCNSGQTMECKSAKCTCKASHKMYKRICVPYNLGEDCSNGRVCAAGSCSNDKCSCQENYTPYLRIRCVHKAAKRDLGKGFQCTTFKTLGVLGKYCKDGLACLKCPNENVFVCQQPVAGASLSHSFVYAITISTIMALSLA